MLHRDEAIERREALLFQNEEEGDGSKPGARKKWRTFEWPDTIQNQSSGLGLYFKTLCYFLIVSTLMSLVGIWPLVTNYLADEFTDTYTLVEADAEPQTCDRNYEVRNLLHLQGALTTFVRMIFAAPFAHATTQPCESQHGRARVGGDKLGWVGMPVGIRRFMLVFV